MKERHLSLLCAGGLILGAFSGTSWAQDADCSTGATAASCTSEDAAGASVASTLSLPLRGLRDENEEAFAKALRGVGRDLFECAGHPQATRDEPGACDACGGAALAKRHIPAFRSMSLEVSGMVQTCRVELTPGETVRLSAITNALKGCDVSLDLEGMRLGADARLHLAGLNCAGCEGKASAALEKLEGVAGSSCTFGTSEESLASLKLAGPGGMEYARVVDALSDAGFRLADVSWTEAGTARAEPTYDLGITGFAKRLGARAELLIHGLVPDGAAEKAGLKEGDRIVTINGGVAFEFTREELTELLGTPEAISFEIERGDETFTVKVTPQPITAGDADGTRSAKPRRESEGKKKPTRGLPLGKAAPAVSCPSSSITGITSIPISRRK